MSDSLTKLFENYANFGAKQWYLPWERSLTRKLNIVSLIGFVNVLAALIIYEIIDEPHFRYEFITVLLAAPFVPLLNNKFGYVSAAYMFNLIGFVFFTFLNLKMGSESYVFLFYFSMMISVVQLLARKETFTHMIINFIMCFISIITVVVGFNKGWLHIPHSPEMVRALQTFNMIFSAIVTLSFIGVITMESQKQEQIIKSMLGEKEVLLAEVFHRVKNNMNIITSLLNLKKESSDSPVVKQALEECKNRVYSMALVHQNIYKSKNFTQLDMKEYIHDLVDELMDANGNVEITEAVVKCEDIGFDLAHAVPFGLILNELITNSFKYARTKDKNLRIEIEVTRQGNVAEFIYRDNGPGIADDSWKKNSLGLELIKSLSSQLDGDYKFENVNGVKFTLKFNVS